MTPDSWLEAHPYLRPIAELSAEIDRAAAVEIRQAPIPDWERYRPDFRFGVTLLHSVDAAIDLEPGGRTAAALIERLELGAEPVELAQRPCRVDGAEAECIEGWIGAGERRRRTSQAVLRIGEAVVWIAASAPEGDQGYPARILEQVRRGRRS